MLELIQNLLNRNTSPLSGPKVASAWIKRVKLSEVGNQLEKVQEIVQLFVTEQQPADLPRLQSILLLDEEIQSSYDMICQQYILNPRMSKPIEDKLWNQIVGFSRVMVQAYLRFIQSENHKPEESGQLERLLPIAMARSLRYVAIEAKWHYFRFEKTDARLWTQAHQLYRLSEVSGVDSNPFSLYPSFKTPITSCADEYLQIMMLATLNNGNFSIRQFDWADRWLDLWSKHMHLERKYQHGKHQFCVNLLDSVGPLKIQGPVEGDMVRYWSVSELLQEVEKIAKQLEQGESPQLLGLGDEVRMPSCLDFIKQLEILWSREHSNQIKRSERHRVSKMVDVCHGFSNINSAIRSDNEKAAAAKKTAQNSTDYDEIMDMRMYGYVTERTKQKIADAQARQNAYVPKQVDFDTWVIENESEGGFGAVLPIAGNDWVRLGVLIALRLDAQGHWMVGVVRRLNRQNQEQFYAGVQLLSTTPVGISMRGLHDDHNSTLSITGVDSVGVVLPRLGLYIPYMADGNRANTIMMQSADYSHDKLYQVHGRDKVFTVKLSDTLEKGVDWTWAVVEVVRKDG